MRTYDDALAQILVSLTPLARLSKPLLESRGCVLADDIFSPLNLPPFDNSAMDGYAARAEDLQLASAKNPITLHVAQEIAAGSPTNETVPPGQIARIFTGGVVPSGADCIVPVEDTTMAENGAVQILAAPERGAFIRKAGGDLSLGARALTNGAVVRPYEIAQAAAMGLNMLPVFASPRVAIIASGSELVEPGSTHLLPGHIYNSNAYALEALVEASGGVASARLHATDTMDSLRACLTAALESNADAIITSGGVSVGDYDFVKAAVEECGGKIGFWRAAIRPGKPFVFGQLQGKPFFGLPGNPVSTMITFELFVRPALRRLSGHAEHDCPRAIVDTVLANPAEHSVGRRSFLRAFTRIQDGRLLTEPITRQDSHMINGLVQANSLLIMPEDCAKIAAGSSAKVMLLD